MLVPPPHTLQKWMSPVLKEALGEPEETEGDVSQ